MSHTPDQFDGWTAQVYRHADPLFRLALLVESDVAAAEGLVQRAFEWMGAGEPCPEVYLLRPLLERRAARPWRMSFGPADAARAGLTQEQAAALAALLAGLTPPERLVLGLHTLRGHAAAAIAELLPALPAPPQQTLSGFRCAAVPALGLLPPGADTALLPALDRWLDGQSGPEEALELRRAVLEEPGARAQRDALAAVRQKLAQALPALVPGGAPARLIDDLLSMDEQPHARPARSPRLTPALLGLVVAVLVLAGAIVAVPAWMRGRQSSAPPAALDTAAILERAARRFERAPLQRGVLHERLQMQNNDAAYTIERWYDYASPHRVAVAVELAGVRKDGATVSTDGRSLIQYRNWESGDLDLRVTPKQAAGAAPLLRSLPNAAVVFGNSWRIDMGPVYLGQARAAQVSSLGQTSYQGRPAHLLTYRAASSAGGQPGRVLLTIDMQTYSLLDVALFADGESESVAQHPLRAEVLEVLDEVPDSHFAQPAAEAVSRTRLTSVYFPSLLPELSIDLEAAGRLDGGLLVPQELPDPTMRGLVLRAQRDADHQDTVIYYEGEFSSLVLLPSQNVFTGDTLEPVGEERTVGAYRYRLLHDRNGLPRTVTAEVSQGDQPGRRLIAVLADSYATAAEREAKLEQVIASLTPLTPQNVAALQERFAASGSAE
jgi:hypothetical protein